MKKLVIGLVGEKGSGKGTFCKILTELLPNKNVLRIGSSDVLVETLDLWGIDKTRENLQDLAIIMDQQFGEGTLSQVVFQRINKAEEEVIIFDGIRWPTDIEVLEKFPNHLLVYVTAPLEIRYQRLKLRKEKTYEETESLEQFLKEEQKKNETLIKDIGELADIKIINDGSLEEFREKINVHLKEIDKKIS